MKKTVYTLFLFAIVCVFCLSGCAEAEIPNQVFQKNAVRILRQVGDDGKIALSYVFPVNSEKLKELGFGETEIKTYRFYLSTYVAALAENNSSRATEGVSVSKSVYYLDVDGVGFTMMFDNVDSQKEFFGTQEENINLDAKSSGLFIRKIEFETVFPVSSVEVAENMKGLCQMAINSWAEHNAVAADKKTAFENCLSEMKFVYDTASSTNTLKSNLMYEANGLKHNVFIKDIEDIKNNNRITFFVSYPNVSVWYAAALIFVITLMIIIYFIKKRKQN